MRIELAEAIGWEAGWIHGKEAKDRGDPPDIWSPPGAHDIGGGYCWHNADELPNPRIDANDCEALIRCLNDAGWFFHRQNEGGRTGADLIRPVQTFLRFHRHRPYKNVEWCGDDWKQGVCELALIILGDDD